MLVMGILDMLAAVKELILPVPEIAGNPIAELVCVHLYSVPNTVDPENKIGVVRIFVHSS
jgi:hypothetical protein